MKKLLGSVLALALVAVTSQANAELLKNFKLGGSVEVDATSARNVLDFQTRRDASAVAGQRSLTNPDRIGAAQTRIMLNMDWDLLDDVHAKVTLRKNNRLYGDNTAAGGSENLNTIQTNVWVDQAYMKIDKVFGMLDSTFGRMFYGEPGDLVIYYGPKYDQYGMTIASLDAGKFDWTGEKAYATVIVGRTANNTNNLLANNGAGLNNQLDLRGLVIGNKGNENLEGNLHIWNAATHRAVVAGTAGVNQDDGNKNDNLYVAGLKVKAKFGGAYGSFQYEQNFGENRTGVKPTNYSGRAILADVGMKAEVEKIGTFNPWGQFGLGTGSGNVPGFGRNENFVSINTDYRPGAIYGRFDQTAALALGSLANGGAAFANNPASNGLTNRVIWGLGVKATPSGLNKLTVGAAFYDFRFQKLAFNGAADGRVNAESSGNKHIGSEIDVTGEWKHSENVTLKGSLGSFQPGGFIKNAQGSNNPAVLASGDVCVKF